METLQYYLNAFGDRYLHEVNRATFNGLGAASAFQRHFAETLFPRDTLNIIIGTDSGLLVRHVQHQGVPDGSRYLFLELDALLPTIRAELADAELDDTIHLASASALNDSLKGVRFSDYANIGAVKLLESIGAVDAYFTDYRAATVEIRQQLDAVLWAYNCQLSNPTFIRCQLRNLVEEHVPAEALRGSFSGKTALLLGGGPSLDDILPWAREHHHHVVIIAVSRICRRLHEAGVTPHIVVSIDPTELSFDISKEMLLLDPRVLFVHANHVAYSLLAQWPGRSVFLDRRYPWSNKLDRANIGAAGPTVTNTAFAVADAMGFSRVIFGGIDLCHSGDGYSHAEGSNERDAGPRLGGTGMRVKTNAETDADTTPDFFNAIRAFGTQVLAAKRSGLEVVNPAPGAAVIDGVDFRTMDQLHLPDGEDDPFDVLHSCLPADSRELRVANLCEVQRELARANGRLRKVAKLAEEALECNAGLFGRGGKTADFRYKKRMDRIERQLDSRLGDLSEIVRMFSSRAFLYMPPSDREWTDEEIEQAGKTYYTAYRENAREVLRLVEQAQDRVQSAFMEEHEAPEFDRLSQQWEGDQIPGRTLVWKHRHPKGIEGLAPEARDQFNRLAQAFNDILQRRDTPHARKVRAEVSLAPVRGRLQALFKERNEQQILHTMSQLRELHNPDAQQLLNLAGGYLAELQGRDEAAFDCYSQVIDGIRGQLRGGAEEKPQPWLEDALRRMVYIAMSQEWHDQALLILETLAELAPAYEPQYAELLRLSGNLAAAAAIYTNYLSKAPGDHVAMLRLGKVYQAMGAEDAAKTAFCYVLEKDPDNKAAQSLLQQAGTAA